MHVQIIGNVVPIVAQRRRKEGQEPETGDAKAVQIVESLRQPLEIADAIIVAVEKRLDVHFVDDGVLVPERVVFGGRCRRHDRIDGQHQVRNFNSHTRHTAVQHSTRGRNEELTTKRITTKITKTDNHKDHKDHEDHGDYEDR